jgi:Sec-independent protein translocase protein TatA
VIPLFIGVWELVVIIAVAILLMDPAILLSSAKFIGRIYHTLQKVISDIRGQISLTNLDDKDAENDDNPSNQRAG